MNKRKIAICNVLINAKFVKHNVYISNISNMSVKECILFSSDIL